MSSLGGRDCGQCFRPTWWDSTPCSLHVMCQPPGIRPAHKIGREIEGEGGGAERRVRDRRFGTST